MKASRVLLVIVLGLLLAGPLAGCAGGRAAAPAKPPAPESPGGGTPEGIWEDWPSSTPEQQGMDTGRLKAMEAAIADRRLRVDSVLIIRHGAVVWETTFGSQQAGTLREMFSVTKSFTSALVGLAIDQGKLSGVDQRVVELLPEREFENASEEKNEMTVEDLLTMTAGLDWVEGNPAYRELHMSRDWVDAVMGLEMTAAPGERFNYCSGCTHVLSAIVQHQVGMDGIDYAEKYLLEPIGIRSYKWERDSQGIPIGGWGLWLAPRDMTRLGYLYLHNGNWQGKQVISERWVKLSTTRYEEGGGRLDYGYQWWVDEQNGAFAAIGRGGQMIYVVPSLDLIVVFTANLPGSSDPLLELIDQYVIEGL